MGLTFTLYQTYISNYLAAHGVTKSDVTPVTRNYLYSRYLYTSPCAIPGPIVASILVETKSIGLNRTGAGFSILTGLFMLVSATSRSRDAALTFECVVSFLHFAGLTTLTLYTVEVVPTPTRGFSLGVIGFFCGIYVLIACYHYF